VLEKSSLDSILDGHIAVLLNQKTPQKQFTMNYWTLRIKYKANTVEKIKNSNFVFIQADQTTII
jgi:hypothetical protein